MSDDLQAMYRYLDAMTARPDLPRLLEDLSRFEIDLDDLSEHVQFAENGYKRNLVRSSPNYHAWVLCWKNGQRSPIHDHTGSMCVVRVLRGTLTETLFEVAPNGHVKASFSRDIAEGSVISSEDDGHPPGLELAGGRCRARDAARLHTAADADEHVLAVRQPPRP